MNQVLRRLVEQNRKYMGKGIRVPRFRKPTKRKPRNAVLLALLMIEDIKLSELAKRLNVSQRSVNAWVYERDPSADNQLRISDTLGYPLKLIFNHPKQSAEVSFDTQFNALSKRAVNPLPVLTGLFMVYDVSPVHLCEFLQIPASNLRTCMRKGKEPIPAYRDQLCHFFRLPPDILFYKRPVR